jgi:hypothetical protein
MALGPAKYGAMRTSSRFFWNGIKWATFAFFVSFPYTYYMCPVCQVPNRGELQTVPIEMRFKNYVDKKYNMFEDSNKLFYDSLTSDDRKKELKKN